MKIKDRIKELRRVKASELVPNPKNWRTHPTKQKDALKGVLSEIGYADALLARELPDGSLMLLDGHLRAETTPEQEVPVLVLDLTEEEGDKLLATLDPLASLAEQDDEKLAELLDSIETENEALQELLNDLAGEEIEEIFESGENDDSIPEVNEKPVSQRGEIYQLGNHRLMCGDSTNKGDVENLMNGEKADMAFTSPPYNNGGNEVESGKFGNMKSQKLYGETGYSDSLKSSEYVEFCKTVLDNCFNVVDGFIFWNVNYNANAKYEYLEQISDKLHFLVDQICWKKHLAITNTKGGMTRIWEPIFVFSTTQKPFKIKGTLYNYWEIDNCNSSFADHRACFPILLPIQAIENSELYIEKVFDPFGGSGSTLIACEQLERKCYMMELDPHYCDVIRKRWAEYVHGEGCDWKALTPVI